MKLLLAQKTTTIILFVLLIFNLNAADKTSWPKLIENPKGTITIYQPEHESLNGTIISGRAAISIKPLTTKKPLFGAIWYEASLEVDRDSRIAVLKNIKIPHIRFSDDIDSTTKVLVTRIIEEEVPKWKLQTSMDDLIATLDATTYKTDTKFKNDAPEIIISNKPAVLVLIDGKPILKELQGYDFQRIENSQYFIVYHPKDKEYFMYGDKVWFTSTDLMAKWELVKKPSKSLKKLQEDIEKSNNPEGKKKSKKKKDEVVPDSIPEIIVRTSPAELIIINGEPEFTPIQQTELLYVKNSDNNVFMDIKSQKYFILITGRWYTSAAMTGPWVFVDADKLPADFAKIPEGTEKDQVLASVAGTEAAKEAVLDAQIPQTAEVNRKTATVKVEYDGEPRFEPVDGTSMLYAVNSPQTVLKVGMVYYCVDNGIWFEAPTANGVWKVTDKRPSEVDEIEASSPVYNVKYVYIYESTPEVVYVGYTPGYYGSYVYGPTVVYGTGWPYYPWYGAYYYPRPVTWGFNMHYNPWYGWGMSFGFAYGPVCFSFGGGYYGGCWGPPMHYPPCHYPPSGGGWYGGDGNYGQRPGNERPGEGRPGDRPGARPKVDNGLTNGRIDRNGNRGQTGVSNNMYRNNRAGVNPTISNRDAARNKSGNSTRQSNNVYTDRSGNVYQKTDKGWQQRDGNSWKSVENRAGTGTNTGRNSGNYNRPSTGNSSVGNRPSTQPSYNYNDINRSSQNRSRGTARTSNYNNYNRSYSSPSRGSYGGGARGGGGGFRGGGGRR